MRRQLNKSLRHNEENRGEVVAKPARIRAEPSSDKQVDRGAAAVIGAKPHTLNKLLN